MKYFAALYSIVFAAAALWAWITYVSYIHSPVEHLLPYIALYIVALPSSLLVSDMVAGLVPWLLDASEITMLSLTTGLGLFQVAIVWFLATRGSRNT